IADLLLAVETTNSWTALRPAEMKSQNGATLTLQPDDSILASGENSGADTYTIATIAGLPNIVALKLEVLPDPSLPYQGPGRHESGNFQLSALRAYMSRTKDGQLADQVRFSDVFASYEYVAPDVNVKGTIDESLGTVWHVWGRFGQRHEAIYL